MRILRKLMMYAGLCIVAATTVMYSEENTAAGNEMQDGQGEVLFVCPLHAEYRVSMWYGKQWHPLTEKNFFHNGMDFVADAGSAVFSAAEGIVAENGFSNSEGNFIIIQHGNGLKTKYTHLKSSLCSPGDIVSPASQIGTLGNTGVSTGAHLHFSVFRDEESMNPEDFFDIQETLVRFSCPLNVRYKVSAVYGDRKDPITGANTFHTGIDLAAKLESNVYAAASGTVTETGTNKTFGNFVIISHPQGYQTLYASLKTITCQKGDKVAANSRIGLVGSTGLSTGPHLHFTVYRDGNLVDPATLIDF